MVPIVPFACKPVAVLNTTLELFAVNADPIAIVVVLTTVVPIVILTGVKVAVFVEFAIRMVVELARAFTVEFPTDS